MAFTHSLVRFLFKFLGNRNQHIQHVTYIKLKVKNNKMKAQGGAFITSSQVDYVWNECSLCHSFRVQFLL